jgi:hypothetical protein
MLSYVGINEVAQSILALGRGSLLAKVDVKSAYRISQHMEDRECSGILPVAIQEEPTTCLEFLRFKADSVTMVI